MEMETLSDEEALSLIRVKHFKTLSECIENERAETAHDK